MIGEAVCDASALVAVLVADEIGEWIAGELDGIAIHAPELVMFEAANILRRQELFGELTTDHAALAFADLVQMPLELFPFEPLAHRVWELRHNLTPYDASYVALAELTDSPLITVDRRIAGAPGLRCPIVTPPR